MQKNICNEKPNGKLGENLIFGRIANCRTHAIQKESPCKSLFVIFQSTSFRFFFDSLENVFFRQKSKLQRIFRKTPATKFYRPNKKKTSTTATETHQFPSCISYSMCNTNTNELLPTAVVICVSPKHHRMHSAHTNTQSCH